MSHIFYEWIQTQDLTKFQPIIQVYGICFNEADEILIIKKPDDDEWILPGGKPESGETHEETLKREMMEEATVTIKNCQPLGVQKITFPQNPNRIEGDEFYQARFVCEIEDVLAHTFDPDDGNLLDRKFVPMGEITNWIKWGDAGDEMFADAIKQVCAHTS